MDAGAYNRAWRIERRAEDPRSSDFIYYCVPRGGAVIRFQVSTATATIYAGYHGNPGYIEAEKELSNQ